MGFWKRKEVILNGSVNRYGSININGQDVGITYRKGSRGSETFSFAPKRIFLDPKEFRSQDAYRVLCPDNPMRLVNQTHRALDDAIMEGWILKALTE